MHLVKNTFLGAVVLCLFSLAAQSQIVQPMRYDNYSFTKQVNIGSGTARITAPSAYLEIGPRSGATKGMLPPVCTTAEMLAISSPAPWLTVLNSDSAAYFVYNPLFLAWRKMSGGTSSGSYPAPPNPDNPNNWAIIQDMNNPIFSIENMPHPGGVYSESSMYAPSPISINDTLFRVYAKGDATNSIHYWESRDSMRTWAYIDTAVYPTPSPTWDSVDIAFPLAVYDNVNDTIHLYYTGGKGLGGPDYGIGHIKFKSNAAHPLTRPSSPMLSNSTASSLLGVTVGFIDVSSMVKKDGKHYWFGSYSATDSVYLFAARGNSWESIDTMWKILSPNIPLNYNGVINPTVYKRGSLYYGVFADSRTDSDLTRDTSRSMLASMYSSDLLTWTRLPGFFLQPRGDTGWMGKQAYDLQFLKVNGGNYDELYKVKGDTLWGYPLKDQNEGFYYGFTSGSYFGCCKDQSGIVYVLPQEENEMNFGVTNHNWRNDISFFKRNNTLALNVPDAGPNVRGALKPVDWRRFDAKADSANGYSYIWNNSTGTPQNASYHLSGNGIILGKHSIGSAWNTHTLNVDGYQNSGLVEVLRNASYFGVDMKTTILGHITRTWTGGSKGLFIQSTYDDGMREQFYRKTHKSIFYPQSDFITFFGEQNDTMRAEFKGANTAGAGVSRTTNGSIVVINNADGYNTTSAARTSYGQQINNTATRESGSNALTNIGLKVSASGGQNNYATQFVDDSVGTNKVWTDVDGTGKGSWRTPVSGGGSGSGTVYVDSTYINASNDSLIVHKNGNRYASKLPSGSGGGGGSPAGNYGNMAINRNGSFATPASDSADWDGGLNMTGKLTNNGDVVIGGTATNNPAYWNRTLTVRDGSHAHISTYASTYGIGFSIVASGVGGYSGGAGGLIGTTSSHPVSFFTNSTGRGTILSTGEWGINNFSPVSTLDVVGSNGKSITTVTGNTTLDATHHTVIITSGTPTITLPAASGVTRREYRLVNQTGSAVTISTYKDFAGSDATTISANSSMTFQSNGTNWYRVQ